jgi:predicted phosphoribosyltransferase
MSSQTRGSCQRCAALDSAGRQLTPTLAALNHRPPCVQLPVRRHGVEGADRVGGGLAVHVGTALWGGIQGPAQGRQEVTNGVGLGRCRRR